MPSRSSVLESENLSELPPAPRLLVELPSRRQVFFNNLFDLLLRRRPQVIEVSSSPSAFWPDVFVASGVRWSRFFESIAMHVLAIACVVSLFGLFQGIEQQRNPALEIHDKVVYYSASEFLPAIDTGSEQPKPETIRPPRKADPLPAKQKIISLPPNHDNTEQTIIAAPEIKLKQHVNLPNIVAVNQAPLPVPTAVATRDISRLQVPLSPNAIIAPPPDPVQRDFSRANMADFQAKVIAPQPSVDPSKMPSRRIDMATSVVQPPLSIDPTKFNQRRLELGNPAIVPPPPIIDQARLNPRQLTMPNAGVVQPPPAIENARQPAGGAAARQLAALSGAPAPIPPPPSVQPGMTSSAAANQMIALSVNPADVKAPVEVPRGSRSGEFAVGAEGKPGATGAPEIKGGGTAMPSAAAGASPRNASLPPGLLVAAPPANPHPTSTVAGTPSAAKSPNQSSLLAMARLSAMPDISHRPNPGTSTADPPKIEEDKVFAGKKSYSMVLNMPNLTSAGGSWVIHFAQLDESDHDKSDISAPVATLKVDPAYPAALRRELVEGTVVLYAVIRKDGTVSDVRVLRSVQNQLDESARTALLHWHFNPGTKRGSAVDLEAVVQVPFKVKALPF
jgi:TonB family protein